MFPGYGDCPYHSPVRVDAIAPLGGRQLDLVFLNLGYAAGVQTFRKRLRTIRRSDSHIVFEQTDVPDRTLVFAQLGRAWLERHFPHLPCERFFDPDGEPCEDALLRLAG
jgi:hypothetical protein